jgi:hypothetical protein
MAITTWLQYADHALAPLCRSPNGSNMPIADTRRAFTEMRDAEHGALMPLAEVG